MIIKRLKSRWLYKKSVTYLENTDYLKLIQASEKVQSYCINDDIEINHVKAVFHHLPLKDNSKFYLSEDNWDLSDTIKKEISTLLNKLNEYQRSIYYTYYYNSKGKFNQNGNKFKYEILPPWIVFPHFSALSSAWRCGVGEEYMEIFLCYLDRLSDKKRRAYFHKYPEPEYMKTNSFRYNMMNHIR